MLLPLYVRANSYNDIRVCRNYLVVGLAILSLGVFYSRGALSKNFSFLFVFMLIVGWLNHQNFYMAAVIEQTVVFSAFCLIYFQLSNDLIDDDINVILNYLRVSCLIQVFLVFLNHGLDFNIYNPFVMTEKVVGSFGQETLVGAYIAVLAPLFFEKKRIALVPIIWAIWLTTSAMSVCAFIMALIAYTYVKYLRKKAMVFALASTICIGLAIYVFVLANQTYFDDKGRYILWAVLIDNYLSWSIWDIIFGRGLGNLYYTASDLCVECKELFTYAHNEYIEILWAWGLFGMGCFVKFIYDIFKIKDLHLKAPLFACVIAILANMFGNFTLHIAPIGLAALLLYICLINKSKGINYGNNCN